MMSDSENLMAEIAAKGREIESTLSGLDRTAMFAAGALHAEIRPAGHLIAVSTLDDAERVREYVEENTELRFHGCHPEDDGHVVTFNVGRV